MAESYEIALELARRGFKVFPIAANAKSPPLWRDWPNRATTEPDRANWPDGSTLAAVAYVGCGGTQPAVLAVVVCGGVRAGTAT